MSTTSALGLAFAIGVIAGLRAMTAPAVVSWAAYLGWIDLRQTWLAFLGYTATPYIASTLAVGELINDKLPKTPSRKAPVSFAARIVTGAFSGTALSLAGAHTAIAGALLGGLGAVVGTLGGYEARTRLVKVMGVPDYVIALLEDAVAIAAGLFIVSRMSS